MQKEMNADAAGCLDEELRDVLIAISVVAKRLATKLENQAIEGEMQCKDTQTNITD